jgi:hypothetical protein
LEQLQLFDINIQGTLLLCRRPFHELTGFIVCAEPEGPLGFLNAVNELFRRSGSPPTTSNGLAAGQSGLTAL